MKELPIATIAAVIVLSAAGLEKAMELPKAKLTLCVVDERGNPLQGAQAKITFSKAIPVWGGGAKVPVTGTTDERGEFSAEGHSDGYQGGQIQKDGYYTGWAKPVEFEKSSDGRWQPWNPMLGVVLKRIVDPVPMYAKRINIGIPKFEQPLGYDLAVGDWVAPHGSGKISDFVLTAHLDQRAERDFDYKLIVRFSNKGDGIQTFERDSHSALKSPHIAPNDSYMPEWVQTRNRKAGGAEETNRDEKRNYFFRVRTVLDEKGNVVSALYGKIYGDFMNFTYYLNPKPNNRSVEFDLTQNLFENVPDHDKVIDP